MKKQLIYLVLLVICLTACGSPEPATVKGAKTANSFGENNNPTVTPAVLAADATASTVSLVSNIPAATDRTFALPTVEELDGQLLFVQGNTDNESRRLGPGGRMYLANFDGSMPVQLAERVSEASVLVSHDGSMVGYAAVDGRRW